MSCSQAGATIYGVPPSVHSDGISQHDGEVKGLAIPKKHKLLKHAQQVPPTLSLVHKEHRNRLMPNHWNVHKKGAGIYGIGADLKQLSVAIGAELAPDAGQQLHAQQGWWPLSPHHW